MQNPAAAAALPPTLNDLMLVCGVPQQYVQTFINVCGATSPDDLYVYSRADGAKTMITAFNDSRPNTVQGRASKLGPLVLAKLDALIWLVHDKTGRNQQLTAADWTPQTVNRVIERKRAAEAIKDNVPSEPTIENIKTGIGYDAWRTKFESDVQKQLSADGLTSLAYVLRAPNATAPVGATDNERRMYEAPHAGPFYDHDNPRVYGYIQAATIGNAGAYQFVEPHQGASDGRAAFRELVAHYEGDAQTKARISEAQVEVSEEGGAKWFSEYQGLSFTNYGAKLKKAYGVLAKNGVVVPEQLQVTRLIKGMTVQPGSELAMAVYTARKDYPNSFQQALTHIYGQVTLSQPPQQKKKPPHRRLRDVKAAHRGRGRGRGRGPGGREYGGGRFAGGRGRGRGRGNDYSKDDGTRNININGIQIANIWDSTKDMPKEDYDKIKDYLYTERNRAKGKPDGRRASQVRSDREEDENDVNADDEKKDDNKGSRNGTAFTKKSGGGRGTYKG